MLFLSQSTRKTLYYIYSNMRLIVIDQEKKLVRIKRNKRRGPILRAIKYTMEGSRYKCLKCSLDKVCKLGEECTKAAVIFNDCSIIFVKDENNI